MAALFCVCSHCADLNLWFSQSEVQASAQVANYIFGNNIAKGSEETSEKIAMTSPVSAEEDFRSMKGGPGEKIAMTSPVATDMEGTKCELAFSQPLVHVIFTSMHLRYWKILLSPDPTCYEIICAT